MVVKAVQFYTPHITIGMNLKNAEALSRVCFKNLFRFFSSQTMRVDEVSAQYFLFKIRIRSRLDSLTLNKTEDTNLQRKR